MSHDVTMTSKLLAGEETAVYGDSGYLGAEKREDAIITNHSVKHIRYKINRRPSQMKKGSARSQAQLKRREHEKSSVRAKVEHVFGEFSFVNRIYLQGGSSNHVFLILLSTRGLPIMSFDAPCQIDANLEFIILLTMETLYT